MIAAELGEERRRYGGSRSREATAPVAAAPVAALRSPQVNKGREREDARSFRRPGACPSISRGRQRANRVSARKGKAKGKLRD